MIREKIIHSALMCVGAMWMNSCASVADTPAPSSVSVNELVLSAVKSMPSGGGYDASPRAVDRLASSVSVKDSRFHENLTKAGASFCSGATYVVFLRTLDSLQDRGTIQLSPAALALYANTGVKDGELVFGRWNANGPGTARLFTELGCGTNFTSYENAVPGDFMKIWWTDEIGGKERGHLVVYLGTRGDEVQYWSSNIPGGYGKSSAPKSKIKRVLFSRLTNPQALGNATRLSPKDRFLSNMLTQPFSWQQVASKCNVQ